MINANPNSPRDQKEGKQLMQFQHNKNPCPSHSEPCPSKSIMYENDNVDPAMPTIIITTPDSIITPKLVLPLSWLIFSEEFWVVVFHYSDPVEVDSIQILLHSMDTQNHHMHHYPLLSLVHNGA